MLSISLSLTREETGWIRQHSELIERVAPVDGLVTKEEITFARRDWHACCDAFHSHARNRIREIQRVMRIHRDPFEPIMCCLRHRAHLQNIAILRTKSSSVCPIKTASRELQQNLYAHSSCFDLVYIWAYVKKTYDNFCFARVDISPPLKCGAANAPLPLHEWSMIELGPIITELFQRPTWVINGGKSGAIAESMFGIGRFIRHFAYLSFNYGFGGGVIIDGDLLQGGNGNAGEFSGLYDEIETERRPALQYLIDRLSKNGVNVPSIHYMRRHFDRDWPGVMDWVEDVTPAYIRLVNAIRASLDPQAIVFGGQIPPALATMLIERTKIFDRPRYGVHRGGPKLIIS